MNVDESAIGGPIGALSCLRQRSRVAGGATKTRCPGPVAVIHPAQTPPTGPVVVGVDGSAASRAAIEYAFAAADARKAPLIAVHCWTDPSIDGPVPAYSAGVVTVEQVQEEERALLDSELAEWIDRYPDVRVQQAVIHDHPTAGLMDYAPFAQLIVVGSRGHGGVAGMLLGEQGVILLLAAPVGIGIGAAFAFALARGFENERFHFPYVFAFHTQVFAVGIVAAAAVVAGLIVRRRVGRLDMVAALRTRE